MTIKPLLAVFAILFAVAACGQDPATTTPTTNTSSRPGPNSSWADFTDPNKNGYSIRVFFELDQYDLRPESRTTIAAWAAWLKAHPGARMRVEGNADERGTREYNLALGERRANSVKDYLVALGVNPSRVKTISYGKERPVALGSNDAAWAQNRRGVTTISGGAGA